MEAAIRQSAGALNNLYFVVDVNAVQLARIADVVERNLVRTPVGKRGKICSASVWSGVRLNESRNRRLIAALDTGPLRPKSRMQSERKAAAKRRPA
jgi:hypothetical protein